MKNFLLPFSIVLIVLSCKKESNYDRLDNLLTKDFVIENNYVKFKDAESFKKTMNELNNIKTSELKNWELEHGIKKSLRAKQFDTTQTSNIEDMLVPDMRFASIINEDGIFAIGDSIHQITNDAELVYKIGTQPYEFVINAHSYPIKKRFLSLQPDNKDKMKTLSMADQYVYYNQTQIGLPPSSSQGTRRVRFYAWSTSYALYCSNGVGMHSQFRTKNIWGQLYWKDSPMAIMEISACAKYIINETRYQDCDADSDSNETNEQCTVGYGVGIIYTYWIYGNFHFQLNSTYNKFDYFGIWY